MKHLVKLVSILAFLCSTFSFAAIGVRGAGDKYSIVDRESIDFDKSAVYFTKYDELYNAFEFSGPVVISKEAFQEKFEELKKNVDITLILFKGTNTKGESDLVMWVGGLDHLYPNIGMPSQGEKTEYLSSQSEKPDSHPFFH